MSQRNIRSTACALAAIGLTIPAVLCPWYTVCTSIEAAASALSSEACSSVSIAQAASGFKAKWLLVFLAPAVTAFAAALAKYSRRPWVGIIASLAQAAIAAASIALLCALGPTVAETGVPKGVYALMPRLGWYMALASNIAALMVGVLGVPAQPAQHSVRRMPARPMSSASTSKSACSSQDLEQGVIEIPSEPIMPHPAARTPLVPRQAMLNRFNVHDNPMAFDSLMPMRMKMGVVDASEVALQDLDHKPEHEMSNEEYEQSLRRKFVKRHRTDENHPGEQ